MSVELQDAELSVFMDNMVFGSVLYKGDPEIPLLFEIVLRLNQVQMRGDLILHSVHISGTRMIEAGIDIPPGENNMKGMMRGMNP